MGSKGLIRFAALAAVILLFEACGGEERKIEPPVKQAAKPAVQLKATPDFKGDSAYAFVQRQVDFGPRVPNTKAHKACAQWLTSSLERFGLETLVQEATVTAFNDERLEIYNIMGRYNSAAPKRILLAAHWDTRPYADRGSEDKNKPIDGANDGGSGVAVLLELAQAIHADSMTPEIGFDILFLDGEDYGKPESSMIGKSNDSWCLGSQYWSKNIPIEGYAPEYGILLDMVGASDAVFPKEGASVYYAPQVVEKVWSIAQAMGHRGYFSTMNGNPLIDDHVYLNKIAEIPTIDIIHYDMLRSDFGPFHHTHDDNMDIIDRGTLKVVGDVVMQVIYQE
ncbi:MAG: M28 family peptidase [Flavobacteriales bacterium]|nr:M28 family peptidase [Flavobacteriales bacterium]